MKRIYYWAGVALTLTGCGYFLLALVRHGGILLEIGWDRQVVLTLLGALLLQALVVFNGAAGWLLLLRGVGERAAARCILALYGLTQPAKYLPGNFGHHAGRTVLAGRCGLQPSRVVLSILLETAWLLVAAVVVGALTFLPLNRDWMAGSGIPLPGPGQLFLLGAAALVLPLFGIRLLNRWRQGPWRRWLGEEELVAPPAPVLMACFGLYAGNFLLLGVVVNLLGAGVFGVEMAAAWKVVGIFTVAWTAGYLVPGAPAGLGVREAILVAALAPLWGEPAAVGTTLLLRLLTVGGDGLAFLAALVGRRRADALGEGPA